MWFKNHFPEIFKTNLLELENIKKEISFKISKELKAIGNNKEFYFNKYNKEEDFINYSKQSSFIKNQKYKNK
jgi:hypothetical protein